MKISDLIDMLRTELDKNGDLEVVVPLDTGQFAMVDTVTTQALFLHDAFDPVYDKRPLARQSKHEHEQVVVLAWDGHNAYMGG